MGQFAFGLLAGVVVGLVMEWVIDWAGLMPNKSKAQTGRKPATKSAASGAPTTHNSTGSQGRVPSTGAKDEASSATTEDEE
jgi:hypothetical protein